MYNLVLILDPEFLRIKKDLSVLTSLHNQDTLDSSLEYPYVRACTLFVIIFFYIMAKTFPESCLNLMPSTLKIITK